MNLGKQLTFSRSINPSICVFYWRDAKGELFPLEISTTKLVGQKEGHAESYSNKGEVKAAATPVALSMGNPHTIEYCNAPALAELIECKFSVRVEPNFMSPHRVDDIAVKETLEGFANAYSSKAGLKYLAKRYVMNICNGSWLWRNQNTLSTTIHISTSNGLRFTVDNVHKRRFTGHWDDMNKAIAALITEVSEALYDPQKYCFIEVNAELKTAFAQEIYPSQAFVDKTDKDKAGKIYQSTSVNDKRTAIIGNFKIGAALQLIDDWYPNADKALRVGSFGADKDIASVHRHPSTGVDFYSLLRDLESLTEEVEAINATGEDLPSNAHFVAACMIKGGLFQQGAE